MGEENRVTALVFDSGSKKYSKGPKNVQTFWSKLDEKMPKNVQILKNNS